MVAGVFGTGIRAGANLLLIPVVLRELSVSELALWYVFLALGNFGNLADFGFGATIPRIYNYLLAGAEDFDAEGLREPKSGGKPNLAGLNRVNVTVQALYLKISLVALGLLAVGGTIFLMKPAAESGFPEKVWFLWALFIVAIGYNLATSHWVLAVQGVNRMRDLQMVYVAGGLSYASCAAIMLFCKMGLASVVVATFVKSFVMHARCRQIYRTVVPAPAHQAKPDPDVIRKLWPNSYKFGVVSLGSFCISNTSVLICSQMLGKEITASFGLTAQIGSYMVSFSKLWLDVKWPELAILRAQGRLVEMAVLFARRLALVMLSFIGMATVVFVAGNALLAWKHTETRLLSAPFLALHLFYLAQGIPVLQFGNLAFTENVVPFFKVSLLTGLGVVLSSLLLTPAFGLWGLLAAPLISEITYSTWFTVRRGFQGQPLGPRQFLLAAIRGHA